MRPPSVYANPACPAGCPCDVARPLHGPHRVAARLVMILLSHRGWPTSATADLLGCDASTVRRWIHRYNAHGVDGLTDRPRPGRPASAARPSPGASDGCWPNPKPGRLAGCTSAWAAPP
jgi:Winged helix-turn helix